MNPAKAIKLYGTMLGLSEAECDEIIIGGTASQRQRAAEHFEARYRSQYAPPSQVEISDGLGQLDYWTEHLEKPSFVYFIQQGEGPVKIGRAKSPLLRLSQLQTGNPTELALRYVVPGDQALERELHTRFREARIRGEWFGLSYLSIILIYGEGLSTEQIADHSEFGSVPASPRGRWVRSQEDVDRSRAEIEKWWNRGFTVPEIVEFLDDVDVTWTEKQLRAELREMRKSSLYQLSSHSRVGRNNYRWRRPKEAA